MGETEDERVETPAEASCEMSMSSLAIARESFSSACAMKKTTQLLLPSCCYLAAAT